MDVIVRISKEKKIEDFRMVIIPSGRSEIGLIRAKNYGIIAYPNKKDFEKIGEMIYWVHFLLIHKKPQSYIGHFSSYLHQK